jgi:hypothetical protein
LITRKENYVTGKKEKGGGWLKRVLEMGSDVGPRDTETQVSRDYYASDTKVGKDYRLTETQVGSYYCTTETQVGKDYRLTETKVGSV